VDGWPTHGPGVPLDLQPLSLLAHLPRCQADERMGIRRYAANGPNTRPTGPAAATAARARPVVLATGGHGDREPPWLRL